MVYGACIFNAVEDDCQVTVRERERNNVDHHLVVSVCVDDISSDEIVECKLS